MLYFWHGTPRHASHRKARAAAARRAAQQWHSMARRAQVARQTTGRCPPRPPSARLLFCSCPSFFVFSRCLWGRAGRAPPAPVSLSLSSALHSGWGPLALLRGLQARSGSIPLPLAAAGPRAGLAAGHCLYRYLGIFEPPLPGPGSSSRPWLPLGRAACFLPTKTHCSRGGKRLEYSRLDGGPHSSAAVLFAKAPAIFFCILLSLVAGCSVRSGEMARLCSTRLVV